MGRKIFIFKILLFISASLNVKKLQTTYKCMGSAISECQTKVKFLKVYWLVFLIFSGEAYGKSAKDLPKPVFHRPKL